MNRVICVLLAILCYIPQLAHAGESVKSEFILGPGAISCGRFLQEIKTPCGKLQYTQWAAGFISGLNHVQNQSVGMGTDYFAMETQLEKYCGKHPFDYFFDAVLDLHTHLSKKGSK